MTNIKYLHEFQNKDLILNLKQHNLVYMMNTQKLSIKMDLLDG